MLPTTLASFSDWPKSQALICLLVATPLFLVIAYFLVKYGEEIEEFLQDRTPMLAQRGYVSILGGTSILLILVLAAFVRVVFIWP